MMLARLSAHKRIQKANIKADLISTVHDSIVWDTTEEFLLPIKKICDAVFADLPKNIHRLFGYQWDTPMACESKYGPNMKDMSKIS